MKIGYVRISKHEQNEDLQIDALKKAGVKDGLLTKSPGPSWQAGRAACVCGGRLEAV
jgi:hypothetical protein